MAPVVTATPVPVPQHITAATATKIKRPPPPGIQTNGAASSRSSPSQSPSMSVKRTPTGGNKAQPTPVSASVNGIGRVAGNRPRREPSGQTSSRNNRINGLRSASLALDSAVPQSFQPRPEVITDEYILKKHAGSPPSLIVHLHATHFRFDQQDGIFPYKSPMREFLQHVRSRTIPHNMLSYLIEGGVSFYDGCLIVELHDHKSAAQSKDMTRPSSSSKKAAPFSVHNYNPYITPSPWVEYPKENADNAQPPVIDSKPATTDGNDKENMPAPAPPEVPRSKAPPKPNISTVILHPTPQSLQIDLMIKASTPLGDGTIPPQTPMSVVPPTPSATSMPPPAKKQRKERMELDGKDVHAAEAQIILATSDPLHLEVPRDKEGMITLLGRLADEAHSEPPPKPKTRKRTVAERAADEALAAENEKFMLTFDERLSSNVGAGQSGVDGGEGAAQSGGAAFEPRFERFKKIADIKREHMEKKEQEKIRQAEQERKLNMQRQQQQVEQAQLRQQEAAEKVRREDAARAAQLRQQQEAQRRTALAQQQAQAQAQAQAAATQAQVQVSAAQSPPNMQHQMSQASHGHPTPGSMAAHRFPQQVSQAPVSSPVVRQGTPQNMSSPMVAGGNVPMQQTNSGMGASPARPSSIVQNHPPMSAPMAVSMSARGSQQSHAAGTPRIPNSTPQMQHGTPINRPMPTPRMPQASPPPGMMAQNSQMGQAMLMGNQNMAQHIANNNMAAHMMAQQQRQRIAAQHMQAAMQGGMVNGQGQQMNMAQIQQMQQQRLLQQQMLNANNAQMMNGNPQMMNAAQQQQMRNLQQQMSLQQQQQMQGQMGNSNFMNATGMNQAQMQAFQQQMLQQQQQQAHQQQHPQQGGQGGMRNNLNEMVMQRQRVIYQQNINNLIAKYGSHHNIPNEAMQQFTKTCLARAQAQVQNMLRAGQQQAMMQQNMQNGMNGGMGM